MVYSDPVERLGDGRRRCCRLLPSLERDRVGNKCRGRQPIDSPSGADDTSQRARHQKLVGDLVRSREHQPFHAGPCHLTITISVCKACGT